MKAMVIYSLYKQQRKNSDLYYWYVKFKDPETGRFGIQIRNRTGSAIGTSYYIRIDGSYPV